MCNFSAVIMFFIFMMTWNYVTWMQQMCCPFTNLFCFSVSELHYSPAPHKDSWKIKKTLFSCTLPSHFPDSCTSEGQFHFVRPEWCRKLQRGYTHAFSWKYQIEFLLCSSLSSEINCSTYAFCPEHFNKEVYTHYSRATEINGNPAM